MIKKLDLYLVLDEGVDGRCIVIDRFCNSTYAKNIIKALRRVVTGDEPLFRVLVYNKEAEEKDILEYGFQIAFMGAGKEDFESSAIFNMEVGVK